MQTPNPQPRNLDDLLHELFGISAAVASLQCRVVDIVGAVAAMRSEQPSKRNPSVQSSLSPSRSQRKHASDSEDGGSGACPSGRRAVDAGSEAGSTEEAQDRNEPVSASPVSVGTAGEVAASPAVCGVVQDDGSVVWDDGSVTSGPFKSVAIGEQMVWHNGGAVPSKSRLRGENRATTIIDELVDSDLATQIVQSISDRPEGIYLPLTLDGTRFDEQRFTTVCDTDKILVVDVDNLRVYGPTGTLDVSRPLARVLAHMADGGVYDIKTLREIGDWNTNEAMKDHFNMMKPKLADIGVELVQVNKVMFKVRRADA